MPVENESWTDEEISILMANWNSMTGEQLQSLIPRHSADAIRRKMGRVGIKLSKCDRFWRNQYGRSKIDNDRICRVDQSVILGDLDNATVQVLLGSMLGDGCVSKQSANLRNYRFVE